MKNLKLRFILLFQKAINRQIEIATALLFFIGSRDFGKYGISTDEIQQRLIGFVNLKYILNVFFPNRSWFRLEEFPDLNNFGDAIFGPSFEVFLALVETVVKPSNFNSTFSLRHLFTHYFFVLALFLFATSMKKHFNNDLITFLSMMLFVGNPRIYSESFYNSKDIVLMSMFMITTTYFLHFMNHPTQYNLMTLGILIGVSTTIRLSGVIWIPILIFLVMLSGFHENKSVKHKIKLLVALFGSFGFSLVMFFPFLWSNPIRNFFIALIKFARYPSDLDMLFEGRVINSENLPIDYILKWIFITTPIYILIILGFSLVLSGLYLGKCLKRKKIDLNSYLLLVSISIPFSSILGIVILDSSVYNGWRHLYYVYPYIVIVILFGVTLINKLLKRKLQNLVAIILLVLIINNVYWQQTNAPLSAIYFNKLFSSNTELKYDIDYWGVGNEILIRKILSDSGKKYISIYTLNNTPIQFSFDLFSAEDKARLNLSDNAASADYILETFQVDRSEDFDPLPSTAQLWYELRLENFTIARIFKIQQL